MERADKWEEVVDWIECWLKLDLRNYQKKFVKLCCENNRVAGLWCRQIGKSIIVSAYVTFQAMNNDNINVMIIAPTQSQSTELFQKVRHFAYSNKIIKSFIRKSTETELIFENGSRIKSLPCGPFGITIRGYTAHIVVMEESGDLKDDIVNTVITPMVAATDGQLIKIGTPRAKNHFYQSCYGDNSEYKLIHVSWQDAVEEGQLKEKFIEEQRNNLLRTQFEAEYEAKFISIANGLFPEELITSCIEEYPMLAGV